MNEEQYKYIEELRQASSMTHQQIAEQSGIAAGTVSRIFAAHPKDPAFATISCIVLAMGGSLDELVGKERPRITNEANPSLSNCPEIYDKALAASRDAYTHAYNNIQAQHEIELRRVKEYLRIKDKWLIAMFAYCIVLTLILAAVSLIRR